MLNIIKIIENGSDFIVPFNLGKSLDYLIENDNDEYELLVPNHILMERASIKRLFQHYYMIELFELSNCYLGTFDEPYSYWHIAKKCPSHVKTSIFYESAHPYRDDTNCKNALRVPDQFCESFLNYLHSLELWVRTGEKPSGIIPCCELNQINIDEYDPQKPYARYYREANNDIRKLLATMEIVSLRELASLNLVTAVNGGNDLTRVKVLDPHKQLSYPYIPELDSIDSVISTEKLHKGDIVAFGEERFFLIDKESEFDLFAPMGTKVIRSKGISPEFLFLYLTSKTAKRISNALKVPLGKSVSTNLGGTLLDFPVIRPQKEEEYYIKEFLKISTPDIRNYDRTDEKEEIETVEQALGLEITRKIRYNNEALIRKQIEEDISELNICYNNKAYKATLILAGSIMEALLIDWLSEIDGVNYFDEKTPYKVKIYDKENNCYKTDDHGEYILRNAGLSDYINTIKRIKKPKWMEEASEAHIIRKKRNYVHAKLCLKKDVKIDDSSCKEVISYLKHIIESREKDFLQNQ